VAANTELEELNRYIAEQFGFLLQHQKFIADLKASGRDIADAERLFASIENTLWDLMGRRKALLVKPAKLK
jgi:hypothetical protein